ncbi:SCO family protein [Methylocapsa acidiphila]|uniref:SCO family protein n=1 Tax=Methylocapsa acidiphila TaxID=133552 RepID=UPI0003F60E8D|nr:SCO family protein [Methylocapsa acidiphila]
MLAPSGAEESAGGFGYPAPGSYRLDHIFRAPQGIVLEGSRFPHLLSSYTKGAITLLSFFYTSCVDPQGCPLAWEAFEEVRAAAIARSDLRGRLRLVFLSLDPARDKPGTLAAFSRAYESGSDSARWHFLTTYSDFFLRPLLHNFGEEIALDRAASAAGAPVFNHLLKVFLIDHEGDVREIYSNQSLDVSAILGDIETLLMEAGMRKD